MMSELARDFFSHNPAMAGPLVAMLLFTAVFVVAVIRAMRVSRSHIDHMAGLVLRDGSPDDEEVRHG